MATMFSRRRALAAPPTLAAAITATAVAAKEAPLPQPPRFDDLRPTGPVDENYWLRIRREFNLRDRLIWLNTGTFGPSPRAVIDTNARVFREQAEDPSGSSRNKEREVVRGQVAGFIGGKPDEVVITRSTTEGVNIFAHGIEWRRGDEVILATHEHPGGYGAYRTLAERFGIVLKWIELPTPPQDQEQIVELYRKAITRRTRLIFASHITFITGILMPVRALADLAHSRGLLISVDGAHSAGCLPVDMAAMDCDHYAAAGQKWLMAGSGTGFCYIRESVQPKVWPLMGWVEPEEKERHTSRRYEAVGQRNIPSMIGMGAAISFQEAIGGANIEARVRALGQRLRQGLSGIPNVRVFTSLDPALNAGITTFALTGNGLTSENLAGTLALRHGIKVSKQIDDKGPTKGWNSVRICTHIFVQPDEVDLVLETVREMVAHPDRYREMKRPEEA